MTGIIRKIAIISFATLAIMTFAGCDIRKMSYNSDQRNNGLVVVFPGIDGKQLYNEDFCRGLVDAGVDADVVLADWTSFLGAIYNQTAVEDNRRKAAKAAEIISKYISENPDSPVYLVGHSGGTAIAVWATELLPREQQVEGIVLLASSLSPRYNMSRAVSKSRKGIINFYSRNDQALLNAGTSLFGTMDGVKSHSAGFSGFQESNSKLVQVGWNRQMRFAGYNGDHFSVCSRSFAEGILAPVFGLSQWSDAEIAAVATGQNVVIASR